MSKLSNLTIKKMAKLYLANTLINIELHNDSGDSRFMKDSSKLTDEETFHKFNDEFQKQAQRIIEQVKKEMGLKSVPSLSLDEIFKVGFGLEKNKKSV